MCGPAHMGPQPTQNPSNHYKKTKKKKDLHLGNPTRTKSSAERTWCLCRLVVYRFRSKGSPRGSRSPFFDSSERAKAIKGYGDFFDSSRFSRRRTNPFPLFGFMGRWVCWGRNNSKSTVKIIVTWQVTL